MKKRLLLLLALSISTLTGCAGSYKVPVTGYEKVKTAFNGVEKSFKKMASGRNAIKLNRALPKYKNVDSGLSTIFSMFNEDDIKGHSIEELSYNEPPMIQFQYLKAVFDKVGQGFEFGTKYYDSIVGEMYVDFATGFKDETKNEANKYSFNYELAIDITINEQDLINADVSFNIDLSQNGQTYNTKWFVNLLLDYDMNNASPTYNLTMLTENDEKEFPFFDRFTYEYDYVDVSNNKINEWRKFCMHASERLVKDDAHPSFSSYTKEGFTFKVDYPKWFKDNNYYKLEPMEDNQAAVVANTMYDNLGLNANDINGDVFFKKQGSQNKVMQDIYKNFSKIYGDEIIYNIVCRDKDDYDGDQGNTNQHAFIRPMIGNGQSGVENLAVSDMQIFSLFNGYFDPFGEKSIISLWYTDVNGNPLEEIRDLNSLSFQFTTTINDNDDVELYIPVDISLDTTILEAYALLKNLNGFNEYSRKIRLIVKDNQEVYGAITLQYLGEFDESSVTPTFPKDLLDIGLPEYKGDKISFDYKRDGEYYRLDIKNSNEEEAVTYINELLKNGFTLDEGRSNNKDIRYFVKVANDQVNLVVKFDLSDYNKFVLEITYEQRQQGGGNQTVGFGITSLCLVGDFNGWNEKEPGSAYVFSLVEEEATYQRYTIANVLIQGGESFKVVANNDWSKNNPGCEYGGYGYDEFNNLGSYTKYFEKGANDGNIVVKMVCLIDIEAVVDESGVFFQVSNVRTK